MLRRVAPFVVVLALGCAAERPALRQTPPEPEPAPLAVPPPELPEDPHVELVDGGEPPAEARSAHFAEIAVAGHEPAVVWVPAGSDPRPLLVVAHGAGGHAEWHCALWQKLTEGHAFIACPRGKRIFPREDSGFFYPDHHALEREVLAVLKAVRAAFEGIDAGPAVYAGYSQGATMGALMLHQHPELFQRLVLIEGGHDWTVRTATHWRDGGGRRVLFACGLRECRAGAQRITGWLERAGVEVRLEYAAGAGHTPAGEVAERVRAALPWLLEGDPRWQPTKE